MLLIGFIYTFAAIVADLLIAAPRSAAARGRGGMSAVARFWRRRPPADRAALAGLIVGAVIVLFWIACALFGTWIAPMDPYADNLLATLDPPSWSHWFGTDKLGRDVLSRVIVGARDILSVGLLATLLGTSCGTILGLAVG